MRAKEYMFVLITSICFILALISFQNTRSGKFTQSDTTTAQIASSDLTAPLHQLSALTADLQQRIDRLDAITQEYERITQEHYSMSAQLRDFGEIMDEVGKMEQKKYMEGRK